MTRSQCQYLDNKKFEFLPENYCANHPHNFYLQLFAEVGLLGLFFGIVLFFKIIKDNYFRWRKIIKSIFNFCLDPINNVLFSTSTNWKFFGQWGNLFLWFGID